MEGSLPLYNPSTPLKGSLPLYNPSPLEGFTASIQPLHPLEGFTASIQPLLPVGFTASIQPLLPVGFTASIQPLLPVGFTASIQPLLPVGFTASIQPLLRPYISDGCTFCIFLYLQNVSRNAMMSSTSSSFTSGFTSHQMYSFSSWHRFSMDAFNSHATSKYFHLATDISSLLILYTPIMERTLQFKMLKGPWILRLCNYDNIEKHRSLRYNLNLVYMPFTNNHVHLHVITINNSAMDDTYCSVHKQCYTQY